MSDLRFRIYVTSRLVYQRFMLYSVYEPPHDKKKKKTTTKKKQQQKTKKKKMACAPSEDSNQPEHPPSLIRVFAVRMKKVWILSFPASHSAHWADIHFVGFVMRRLSYDCDTSLTSHCFATSTKMQIFPSSKKPEHDKTNKMTCAPSEDS